VYGSNRTYVLGISLYFFNFHVNKFTRLQVLKVFVKFFDFFLYHTSTQFFQNFFPSASQTPISEPQVRLQIKNSNFRKVEFLMKKANETLWVNVEGLAIAYAKETNQFAKQDILAEVFEAMKKYIRKCVNNAVRKAENYGVQIPREDFESRFMQYLWEALEAFESDGGSTFKNIVLRRFRFAETHTWRQYKTKGNENDKDGVSYIAARWDSLDRKIGGDSEEDKTLAEVVLGETKSAEAEFLSQREEMEIIDHFAQVNERYANVIRFMALGYDGDALAIATGEADSNNAKMRKLIQRSKEAFANFMAERMSR
jgi:hypothetical protein